MPEDAERLRAQQERREAAERALAEEAADPAEERAHERRAEKAAYLKDKLRERSGSDGAP